MSGQTIYTWVYSPADAPGFNVLGATGQPKPGDGNYLIVTEDEAEARAWHALLKAGRLPPIPETTGRDWRRTKPSQPLAGTRPRPTS